MSVSWTCTDHSEEEEDDDEPDGFDNPGQYERPTWCHIENIEDFDRGAELGSSVYPVLPVFWGRSGCTGSDHGFKDSSINTDNGMNDVRKSEIPWARSVCDDLLDVDWDWGCLAY